MKILKIEGNKGYYKVDETEENWLEIDKISKEDLLTLLKFATEKKVEMDEYKDQLLQNPAHNIIYRNIYGKFSDLIVNKTRFRDSVELMYKAAIDKYS